MKLVETELEEDEHAVNFDVDFEITNLKGSKPEQGELF